MDQKMLGSALILIMVIAAVLLVTQPAPKEPVEPAEAPEVTFTPTECDTICQDAEYEKGECLVPSSAESHMVRVKPCNQMGSVCYCYNEPEVPETPEEPVEAELYCVGMPLSEAEQITEGSECDEGTLTDDVFCNNVTRTWWINLDLEREGCSPACVINVDTKTAEINWRCTGLVP